MGRNIEKLDFPCHDKFSKIPTPFEIFKKLFLLNKKNTKRSKTSFEFLKDFCETCLEFCQTCLKIYLKWVKVEIKSTCNLKALLFFLLLFLTTWCKNLFLLFFSQSFLTFFAFKLWIFFSSVVDFLFEKPFASVLLFNLGIILNTN